MARLATVDRRTAEAEADAAEAWYRAELAEPASFPWAGSGWEPVRVGPTWQTDGGHWLLPERTIGWRVLGWCGANLQLTRDVPWRFTLEQARFVLWWFAVDERGRWLYRDGALQRLKGWGKDPLGACLIYVELVGPCRVAEMVKGQPVAVDNPAAWVQTAAVSLEQTKNTMLLLPALIHPDAKKRYGIRDPGKQTINCHPSDGSIRFGQAVTSSPAALEGARASLVLKNETHLWLANNAGHEMAAVIERNATKSPDGSARTLAITNAPEPGMDSMAERDWDAFEKAAAAGHNSGLLVDSLEAPPEAPLAPDVAPEVVTAVRGDSVWLDPERIVQSIMDTRNPPSRSRRFWYNQRVAAEDAWLDPRAVDFASVDDWKDHYATVPDTDFALFFDGSKSDDATGLVGARMGDGHVLTLGVWQRPTGGAGDGWIVDRADVDRRVRQLLDTGKVTAFYADPSHARDDDVTGFWDAIIDGWHRDYGAQLDHWSVRSGDGKHSIMWDMTSMARQSQFTDAAMTFVAELEQRDEHDQLLPPLFTLDGHPALSQHLKNARRWPNKWGVTLGKEHRESARKIDLAVCAVGARMLRRVLLNAPSGKQPGKFRGYRR